MSSSSSISTSTVNGTTRVTGLSSGIDVDGIVEQLVTAEKAKKLNKLQREKQTSEWTQTAYRDIISDLQDFSSKYFSTTSSSSIMKASNFLQYSATSSDTAVKVTSASTASAGSHTVAVSQLATKATLTSSDSISKDVKGSVAATYTSLSDESFVMTLDGTDYTVDLDAVTTLATLQTAIDTAAGAGKVTVSADSTGILSLTAADDGVQAITISATSTTDSGLADLGFGTTAVLSNRLDTSDTLATIADQLRLPTALNFTTDGEIELTINGTAFTFDEDDTLAEMMSDINTADIGVTMTYNALTGALVMAADDTGAGNTLVVTDTDATTSNFATLLLSDATAGLDAQLTIDGQALTRSSNSVTLDGVTYTLNQKTTEEATVTVVQNTEGVYDLISAFVEDYNALIETINTAVDENSDSDYPPLTDDEKEEMTDDEITAWETQAKVGLLESDSTLESLLSDLRTSLIDSVSSQISLTSIGITSGTYDEQGALYIDEDVLTTAIASDPQAVMNLFTQQSSTYPGISTLRSLSASELSTRYSEEGIAYRFYDTLQKSISSTRDTANNKGTLLELAGAENDATETNNTLTTLLEKYADEIEDEEDRLDDFEESLYTKYTTLETYISTMNSQLSSLTSMTSS